MDISGVEIDFQDIISGVSASILEEFSDNPWKYESGRRIEQLNLVVRGLVWHEMVKCLKESLDRNYGTVRAEEAMAEAMRRGLKRENIRFRKNAFIACLTNTQFKVRKRGNGYDAGPEAAGGYGSEEMGWCSPSMFTNLIFAFDALVPQIDSSAIPILNDVLEAKRNREREKMANLVQMTAIKALADKYLTPLGITWTPAINGKTVTLQLELLKRGSIEAPLDELPGLLEDTASVMEVLTPVKDSPTYRIVSRTYTGSRGTL